MRLSFTSAALLRGLVQLASPLARADGAVLDSAGKTVRLGELVWPVGICAGLLTCSLIARAAEPWTLEQALDYARVHNPDACIARQRIAAAQAGLELANSAFGPRLQVESSYTRTDNPMLAFGDILNQRRRRCGGRGGEPGLRNSANEQSAARTRQAGVRRFRRGA